jgi:hypothetical protein
MTSRVVFGWVFENSKREIIMNADLLEPLGDFLNGQAVDGP